MNVGLVCRTCRHAWQLHDEPRQLASLACPRCQTAALPQAAEDLASALEDALVQLHKLGETHDIEVQLSTAHIPPEFLPEPQDP